MYLANLMKFIETELSGAYVIEIEKREDERGFFARAYCEHEFKDNGLNTKYVQSNISYNDKLGTLRGMHLQKAPHGEIKLVRCIKGAIYDVILDLRKTSATFKQWRAFELTQENHQTLYIPDGFAHGFITLEDNVEVFYQHSTFYAPNADASVRWDDPAFDIKWPEMEKIIISDKDKNFSNFG